MTLIELLTVITIMTMMATILGLVVPSIGRGINNTRARADIQKLMMVLLGYNSDTSTYPDAKNHQFTSGNSIDRVRPEPNDKSASGFSASGVTRTANDDNNRSQKYTTLVWALGTTQGGWGRPTFFDAFTSSDLNRDGALVDPWATPYAYISKHAYEDDYGTKLGDTVLNPESYQIYSAGSNRLTYTDTSRKAGTEDGDINCWTSLVE